MKSAALFFIQNYKFTIVLSVFLFLYGLLGLRSMNSEVYPAVSLATAKITTQYKGASADDVETKITKPIEDEIKAVVGIKDVSSVSKSGLSSITVRVDMDNYDVAEVMDEIQKKLEGVPNLPNDLREKPEFREINSEEIPVYQIAVLGENTKRQRDYVAEEVQEVLQDIESVKSVDLKGHAEREFQIRLSLARLRQYHIGVSEVIDKIRSRNVNIPGGNLRKSSDEALVRVEGKIKSSKDLERFLIRSNFSGQQIFLKDIAEVVDSQKEKRIITRYNGQAATLVTVVKKAGEDTIRLVDEAKRRVKDFRAEMPVQGIQLVPFDDASEVVQSKLNVLASNAATGLVLVILFLFIFLPVKIGMAASLSLPLAVMATFGIMPAFGMNLDAITVLALIISIGMLVDNSVVISETYTRFRSEGLSATEAASRSVSELWGPITASAFTTIAAFLPMLVTKGVMGAFILVIPIIVTASLLFSLVESFFLLPMRLMSIAKDITKLKDKKKKSLYERFQSAFEGMLRFNVRHRYLVMGLFTLVIGVSFYFMVVLNKFILFPPEETEVYLARFEAPNGTSVEKTDELAGRLSQEVKRVLGTKVDHIVGTSGEQGEGANDPKAGDGSNLGMLHIYVSDDTKFNVPYAEVLRDLRTIQPDYLKKVSFEEIINGPPVGTPIESKFRSNDADALQEMVTAVMKDIQGIPGIKDLKVDDIVGEDEVFVKIKFAQADRVGLSVNEIGDTIRSAIAGRVVSQVTLNNKDVDLKVRFKRDYREDLGDLKQIKILNRQGRLISLGSLADFERRTGSPQIKRYKNKRSKTIVGSVDDTVITSQLANQKVKASFQKHRKNIKGVSLYQGGAAESTQESVESLKSAGLLAGLGIFALLVFMFNSFLKPFIIMSTIPLGLFGFSIAFYAHNKPISFLALIGVIGLAGIIVNSGIVLISYIDQLRSETELELNECLVQASKVRLRAVLVTSLTTISGLFPTAYGVGGHDAMLIPMTLAMAWGLTTGTVLTLVWVPSAYRIMEDVLTLFQSMFEKVLSPFRAPSIVLAEQDQES